jgi:hypothetical protein
MLSDRANSLSNNFSKSQLKKIRISKNRIKNKPGKVSIKTLDEQSSLHRPVPVTIVFLMTESIKKGTHITFPN